MRMLAATLLIAAPAFADTPKDTSALSGEALLALAAAERETADAHDCCDWGGMGCRIETLAQSDGEVVQPPVIPLITGAEAPEYVENPPPPPPPLPPDTRMLPLSLSTR